MLSTVLMSSESNSAVTVIRLSSSRSEKPSNGINSLTGTGSARTGKREDRGLSSESEDSDKEMTSASFEGDAASKI